MSNNKALSELIGEIRQAIQINKLTVEAATRLGELGYKGYDLDKFPQLSDMSSVNDKIGESPESLAEAFLWKLGKWKAYKIFVQNYNDKTSKVSSRGGVIFSAFAKHLQDNNNPIFDQHTIRALWAICSFSDSQQEKCKSFLFNRSSNWKGSGSGDDGSCYELFVSHIASLCKNNDISSMDLDHLLMPLGQAIKKCTKSKKGRKSPESDYERFCSMCWPGNT